MPAPHVIIQLVHMSWSKSSRGGMGARRRNELPKQYTLPRASVAGTVVFHQVSYSEWSGFKRQDKVEVFDTLSDIHQADLLLDLRENELSVKHVRDPQNAAVGNRLLHELDAFTLEVEEWGELRYNGRYVDMDTGNWWYEQSVYIIGLFANVKINCFRKRRPDHRFLEIARLH